MNGSKFGEEGTVGTCLEGLKLRIIEAAARRNEPADKGTAMVECIDTLFGALGADLRNLPIISADANVLGLLRCVKESIESETVVRTRIPGEPECWTVNYAQLRRIIADCVTVLSYHAARVRP